MVYPNKTNREGEHTLAFIDEVKKSFNHLPSYNDENLAKIVRSLNLNTNQIVPYITQPENLEYGRNVIYKNEEIEIIVIYLPAMAKTLVHDHGTSIGCIAVVKGNLLNVVYNHNENKTYPLYKEIQIFSNGDIFHVTGDTIHMMFNPSNTSVVTFHVYSPPLNGGRLYTADGETLEG
jgi:cysteine dioxygenase